MNKFLSHKVLALSILAALATSHAHAQSNDTTAQDNVVQDNPVQLDNVDVTAQRRKEDLQKTPMSISVVGGAQLDRLQVTRIDDMKFVTPNIVIEQNTALSSGAKIFMRGIGTDESMFTTDPAVAIYIDDVYIPRQNGAMLDLFDVERIEVLRGPQGTLYGRNATGGAIRYITRKPTGDNELKLDATLGNYGQRNLRLSFNTRLGESLDVSGAVMSNNRDGYIRDLTHQRDVGDKQVNAARLGFNMPVGESTYVRLNLDYLKDSSGPVFASPVKFDANGKVVPVLGSLYNTRSDINGFSHLRQFGVALTTDTDFDSFSLRNIVHHRGMEDDFLVDMDGTEQTRYHLHQDQKQRQYGYEAQLTSQLEGPFSWVGGFFAFKEINSQPTRNDIFGPGATNDIRQNTNALALYWQGTYGFTDRFRVTGGARYSYENKDFSVISTNVDGTRNFAVHRDKSWTRPDWKLETDYDFTDNVMGYVSVTTGFKSGGFNGRATTEPTVSTVDAETMLAYEVGLKTTLFDNRLRLNADYYRLDYSELQLTAVDPNGVFVMTNATGALVQGIEIDAQAQLTSQWNIGAGLGTIDAKYQNYSETNSAIFAGKGLKNAPDFQWHLSTTYIQPLPNADLVLSAQVKSTSSYYQNQDLSRLIMTPANRDVGARISYEPKNANWSLALWGKNLTNNHLSAGGFDIPGLGIGVVYPNMPRTYGMDFKYRFL